jgi:hypothetical protein
MVTSEQCRAARGLLGWSQQTLRAGVGIVTVRQLEAGLSQPCRATLEVIHRGLEAAGVEFIDDNGGGSAYGYESGRKSKCKSPVGSDVVTELPWKSTRCPREARNGTNGRCRSQP